MSRLIGFEACGLEEVVAFLDGEQVTDMADGLPKLIVSASRGFADQGLELGEGYFNRVQVRAVSRHKQEPCAGGLHRGCGLRALVRRKVVENDHVAGHECRKREAEAVQVR